jgi:2-pyrone-4,6-dicarboxylate lactonase
VPNNKHPSQVIRGASSPAVPLPPYAWDTHAHVFGPFDRFPLAEDCRYQPPLATSDAHIFMLDAAGFTHGVLVHASANGFDNSAVLEAVQKNPSRLHAVAVVPEDVSDGELLRLHDAGVRGLRFTENGAHVGAPSTSGTLGLAALRRLAPRLQELGWYAQIWAKCQFLVESQSWLANFTVPLVIDHMGGFDVTRGVKDQTFQSFLTLLDSGSIWVKLVPVRVSKLRWNDCEDVRSFHDALLEKAPNRMLWGSDWPYIAMDKDLPDVGRQIDLFDAWTSDAQIRKKVFVDNPLALYARAP